MSYREYRLSLQDMTVLRTTSHSSPWGGIVYAPMKEVLQSSELFLNFRNRLRAGDTVRLSEFAKRGNRVLSTVEVLITEVGDSFVDYMKLGAIKQVPAPKSDEPAEAAAEDAEAA